MRLQVAVIFGTVTLDAMGIGLILPIMPELLREVGGGSLAEAALWGGILSTVFAVMQFVFGPILGSLSDAIGRRPVLLVSRSGLIDDVAGRFDSSLALGEIAVPIHRNFERRVSVFLLTGFRGYPE